jgi:aspartate--ammonia ligase
LNGDILIWWPVLNMPKEKSFMRIRINSESLNKQLVHSGYQDWKKYEYHQKVLNNELSITIGHIGEVQVSVWPNEKKRNNKNIL